MNDERTSVAADEDQADAAVLVALLDESHPIWSLHELGREIGDQLAATDSVARLHAAGLVHRIEDFVFATRAARHGGRLEL